ncbi:MAG: hypothetical protein ACKOQP_01250 [Bacteroidota bacterium]
MQNGFTIGLMFTKMKWIKRIPAILILTTLNGCSEKYCLERFPGIERRETVFFDTVIVTSSTTFDTIFRISGPDTIFLKDQATQIQVKVVRLKGDTVFVESVCPPDTITVERVRSETNFERIRTVVHDNWKKFRWPVGLLAAVLFALGFAVRSFKRK